MHIKLLKATVTKTHFFWLEQSIAEGRKKRKSIKMTESAKREEIMETSGSLLIKALVVSLPSFLATLI